MSESPGTPPPQVAEAPARWVLTPRGQVLVDSGPLLALFNAADHWHAPVLTWLQAHPDVALVSTWPVLTEVCALLARRVHNQAALDFLLWAERGALHVDAPADGSLAQMRRIAQRFADLPLDLADASIAGRPSAWAWVASSASMPTSMSITTRAAGPWSTCRPPTTGTSRHSLVEGAP